VRRRRWGMLRRLGPALRGLRRGGRTRAGGEENVSGRLTARGTVMRGNEGRRGELTRYHPVGFPVSPSLS
jgi:hypothetical protein